MSRNDFGALLQRNWGAGVLVLLTAALQASGITSLPLTVIFLGVAVIWSLLVTWRNVGRLEFHWPVQITPESTLAVEEVQNVDLRTIPEPDPLVIAQKHVDGLSVRLSDLFRNGPMENKIFTDCIFYGPGVWTVDGDTVMNGGFGSANGDLESVLIEVPEGKAIDGILIFRNCIFRRCSFRGAPFIGVKERLDQLREAVRRSEARDK
jgi:hypothetical protein